MNVEFRCISFSVIQMEELVAAFIAFEIGIRGMSPISIKKTYLCSINSYFIQQQIRNEFGNAYRCTTIRFLLRGYIRIFSLMHPASGTKKLAFTIELVQYAEHVIMKSQHQQYKNHQFIWAVQLALKFGIYFLLRKSEFLPGRAAGIFNTGLKWLNVRFFDKKGIRIPWTAIRFGCAKSVEILIPKSKTDQFGFGRLVKHDRVIGPNCIVGELEKWATYVKMILKANESDSLFYVHGHSTIIIDLDVSVVMKLIVVFLGWDDSKISPHSMRYGGATMLAAAGFPQYVIEYFGGWAADSKTVRHYIQLSGEAVTRVSEVFAQGFNKSLEESRIRSCKGK
jgi:hypothetical protein